MKKNKIDKKLYEDDVGFQILSIFAILTNELGKYPRDIRRYALTQFLIANFHDIDLGYPDKKMWLWEMSAIWDKHFQERHSFENDLSK